MDISAELNPNAALKLRDELEARILRAVDRQMDEFLAGVIDDASEAYGEPTEDSLTASARTSDGRFAPGKDPFAFTNVVERWRKAYRALAADPEMAPTGIADIMEAADLPHRLHAEVVAVMAKAYKEGASNYALRRRLAAVLIPRQRPNQPREAYRASVGAMARNAATTTFNQTVWEQIQQRGLPYTMWVARMDDRTRHTHRALNGRAVPTGTSFRSGSAVIRFPRDPLGPPSETYGCRCVIVGVNRPQYTTSVRSNNMSMSHNDAARLMQYAEDSDCGCEEVPETNFAVEVTPEEDTEEELPKRKKKVEEDEEVTSEENSAVIGWSGIIGMEDELTGDGRLILAEAIDWSDMLPVPLRYVASDIGGHDGATTIGQVKTVERREGGVLWGTGTISDSTPAAREALGQIERGDLSGVSMDLDSVAFEVRVASELLEQSSELLAEGEEVTPAKNPDGTVTVMSGDPSQEVFVTTSGRLRGLTLVSIPAFAKARIQLDAAPKALVASAGFDSLPKLEMFDNPRLDGPSPLRVTRDGRVYGHLATWDACHIANPTGKVCTTAPHSNSGYSYFHTSVMETEDGELLPVGKLTVDTGHAKGQLGARDTLRHYDNTGATAAFVRAGEDSFGIWVAGIVSPDATKAQLRALSTSPLSGDWRSINGNLELVAALSVNVPGFPIPRTSGVLSNDRVQTLVAAGMIAPEDTSEGSEAVEGLSPEDIQHLRSLARREARQLRQDKREELSRRLKKD